MNLGYTKNISGHLLKPFIDLSVLRYNINSCMASITKQDYGEGSKFVFKPGKVPAELRNYNYSPGKDILIKTFEPVQNGKLGETVERPKGSKGPDMAYLKDKKGIVHVFRGKETTLKSIFNVAEKGGTKDTEKRTECSETVSLIIFKNKIENSKILNEEQCIEILNTLVSRDVFEVYNSTYYESALKQVEVFQKKIGLTKGYVYERQKKDITKVVYNNVSKLGGPKSPDNFNPGDLWIIKKDYAREIQTTYPKFDNINTLITEIALAFQQKKMISVSLKATQRGQPSAEIIDPRDEINKELDIDLGIKAVNIGYGGQEKIPFNNPTIITKSGFTIRLTHKGSPTLYFEGSFASQDFQLGAIDAKKYNTIAQDKYQYELKTKNYNRIDTPMVIRTLDELKKVEASNLFKKIITPKQTKDLEIYKSIFQKEGTTDVEKKARIFFIQFVSIMYYIFVKVIAKDRTTDKHMKFAFNLARKVQEFSSVYVKVIG